jgi:hypothetical protein
MNQPGNSRVKYTYHPRNLDKNQARKIKTVGLVGCENPVSTLYHESFDSLHLDKQTLQSIFHTIVEHEYLRFVRVAFLQVQEIW